MDVHPFEPLAGRVHLVRRFPLFSRRATRLAVASLPAIVAGSGLLSLAALMGNSLARRAPDWLRSALPLQADATSSWLQLLFGFSLVLTAVHLWARKKRALHLAVGLSLVSSIRWFQHDQYSYARGALAIAALLTLLRRHFRMGSARPNLPLVLKRGAVALGVAAAYGAAGLWVLEPHHFGHNFHWWEAVARTLRGMFLLGDVGVEPLTSQAAWFLKSLFWINAGAFFYCGVTLFRPVAYRFRQTVTELERARAIAAEHGKSAQDFFKQWPDKSFFFSRSGTSFLAYRVANHFALALGDPVGPGEDLQATVRQFVDFCQRRGWRTGFHQVQASHLHLYEQLGFRGLKIGDEAVVNLDRFTLEGSEMKEFRNTVNRLGRLGFRVRRFDSVDDELLQQLKSVSDEWLALAGHRERRFTLGSFDRGYLRETPVYAALDATGKIAAFLNLVPSYQPDLATVDLMRRCADGPSGAMDYLFALTFLDLKARGFRRFSLGMAPMAAFAGQSTFSIEERLVRWSMLHLPRVFRTDSLRRFKAKYANDWEPLYEVYSSRWDLPHLALALLSVTEGRAGVGRAA